MKEIIDFVKDDERLREERKKAKKNRDKYVGMSGLSASLHYGNSSAVFFDLSASALVSTPWAIKNVATLLLFISSPIIDCFSKFFHWHTLQTTYDNVSIIHHTTR